MMILVSATIKRYFDELGKELEDLTPLDIKGYVIYKQTDGRKDGKSGGLSPASVRKHLNIIKQILREATLYGVIKSNPADPVRTAFKAGVSDKAKFIPVDVAKSVLRALEGHQLYPVVYVTLYYGLRRSEVLGLRWSAVDFYGDTLTICHTVVKNTSIVAKDKTKTESSRRTFPLLPEVKILLRRLHPAGVSRDTYIFSRADKSPLRPDTVTRGFQRAIKRKGIVSLTFHDLRHATASILFDAGWSIPDVQHWLGHSDIKTTMNIYVAYNASRKLKIGGALEGLFKD